MKFTTKWIKQSKQHLEETGWGYWYHLYHSLYQSGRLVIIALKSVIHGIFPWVYASAGPLGIYKIYKEIKKHQHVQKMFHRSDNANY